MSAWQWLIIWTLGGIVCWNGCDSDSHVFRFVALQCEPQYDTRCLVRVEPDPTLVMQMMMVSLQSGASMMRCLAVIGQALPGETGNCLLRVSQALSQADSWREAWSPPYAPIADSVVANNRTATVCYWLSRGLHDSWVLGASAVPMLKAFIDNYERSLRNVVRSEGARLTVRLLLPVGLCFLPAFIAIGILPIVASMMKPL